MFTGIIEAQAAVKERTDDTLVIERPAAFTDLKLGASVAVNGCCLSVTKEAATELTFDVITETWNKTNLGQLKIDDMVNLERAMKASDRFEGHLVQGHIEGVGKVTEVGDTLTVSLPDELRLFVVNKGSIGINGVALTVAKIEQNMCSVALIPHTLDNTNLGSLKLGELVNVETDILGRYVHAMLQTNHEDH